MFKSIRSLFIRVSELLCTPCFLCSEMWVLHLKLNPKIAIARTSKSTNTPTDCHPAMQARCPTKFTGKLQLLSITPSTSISAHFYKSSFVWSYNMPFVIITFLRVFLTNIQCIRGRNNCGIQYSPQLKWDLSTAMARIPERLPRDQPSKFEEVNGHEKSRSQLARKIARACPIKVHRYWFGETPFGWNDVMTTQDASAGLDEAFGWESPDIQWPLLPGKSMPFQWQCEKLISGTWSKNYLEVFTL